MQTSTGFYLTCLTLKLIVHIKTMWFITFSTKHPICKTCLRLSKRLIKVKTKTLQACLSEFCDRSQLLFIALHFQVMKVIHISCNCIYQLLAALQPTVFKNTLLTKRIYKRLTFSVCIIQSEEIQ